MAYGKEEEEEEEEKGVDARSRYVLLFHSIPFFFFLLPCSFSFGVKGWRLFMLLIMQR